MYYLIEKIETKKSGKNKQFFLYATNLQSAKITAELLKVENPTTRLYIHYVNNCREVVV